MPRASPFFSVDRLGRLQVEGKVSYHLLKTTVLFFELLESFGVRHVHAAVLALPSVKGLLADPKSAAYLGGLGTGLDLSKGKNDLFLGE